MVRDSPRLQEAMWVQMTKTHPRRSTGGVRVFEGQRGCYRERIQQRQATYAIRNVKDVRDPDRANRELVSRGYPDRVAFLAELEPGRVVHFHYRVPSVIHERNPIVERIDTVQEAGCWGEARQQESSLATPQWSARAYLTSPLVRLSTVMGMP